MNEVLNKIQKYFNPNYKKHTNKLQNYIIPNI